MSKAFEKFDLTGKTALVTGGATGIGYYMTRGLIRSGATVMMAARRENVLRESAAKLSQESDAGQVLYITVDLNDRDSIQAMISHTRDEMGGVDIFIGNAGTEIPQPSDQVTPEAIDQQLQVNLSCNMQLCAAFLPQMREKRWGRIMFSSSGISINASAQDGLSTYIASKAALNGYARSLSAENGHYGITANSLVLGMYLTPMLADHLEGVKQQAGEDAVNAFTESFTSMTAVGRLGRCDEVEGLIQFLASDAASYVTGAEVTIDGGLTTMLRPNPPPESPVYPSEF